MAKNEDYTPTIKMDFIIPEEIVLICPYCKKNTIIILPYPEKQYCYACEREIKLDNGILVTLAEE